MPPLLVGGSCIALTVLTQLHLVLDLSGVMNGVLVSAVALQSTVLAMCSFCVVRSLVFGSTCKLDWHRCRKHFQKFGLRQGWIMDSTRVFSHLIGLNSEVSSHPCGVSTT